MTIRTLGDLVFRLREVAAGRPDLLNRRRGDRLEAVSTTDVLRNVHSLALALEAEGARPGDRIAIFSENRPEWHEVDLACQLLGLPTVPIFPALPASQAAYILRNSGSRWVFYSDAARRDVLIQAESRLAGPVRSVAFDEDAVREDGTTLFRLMGDQAEARGTIPLERFRDRAGEDDLASIVYTSGTLGDPKGVRLTHRNLVSNILACSEIFDLRPEDRAISFMPLSHIFQRTVDYLCLYRGVPLFYVPSVERLPRALGEVKPSLLVAPPQFYVRAHRRAQASIERLPLWRRKLARWGLEVGMQYAKARHGGIVGPWLALERRVAEQWVYRPLRQRFGGRLRLAITGGAALPEPTEWFFEAVGLPIFQGYGLTETSPVLTVSAPGRRRPGSVGRALPGVEIRLDEDGEILVRGPGIMDGYWENPQASADALEDGWLRTGDLGEIDAAGFVFVTGRKKDLIVTSAGENVAPQPIEQHLSGLAGVQQAVVLGNDRPYLVALIVPDFELWQAEFGEPSADGLIQRPELVERVGALVESLNEQLAQHEKIRRFALLSEPLTAEAGELTPTLKPRRLKISEIHRETLDRLYAR